MDDATWNEIIGGLAGPDDSAVEEAATEAATPESSEPPTNDASEEISAQDATPVPETVAPETIKGMYSALHFGLEWGHQQNEPAQRGKRYVGSDH